MAFDGVGYLDAPPIYPAAYHPGSPLTGPALGRALRIAYLYAHHHGRMIIDQPYPLAMREASTYQARTRFAETSYVRIAEGYRTIPAEVTHLVAEALFAADDAYQLVVYHRIVVTDGSNTDTGSAVETQVPIQARERAQAGDPWYGPYGPRYRHRARCEVELDTVTTGAVRQVYVEAYGVRVYGTTPTVLGAAPYQPQHVGVWTEIR